MASAKRLWFAEAPVERKAVTSHCWDRSVMFGALAQTPPVEVPDRASLAPVVRAPPVDVPHRASPAPAVRATASGSVTMALRHRGGSLCVDLLVGS